MRSTLAISSLVVLCACGPDASSFGVEIKLERRPAQMCSSDVCSGIAMSCEADVQIRVVDDHDETTWYSDCIHVLNTRGNLCALNDIVIPNPEVQNGMVRIQIAIWPSTPEMSGCHQVQWTDTFTAQTIDNDPENPLPALAGWAYFDVGSQSIASVTLGCIDEPELDACASQGLHVTAGVVDFDTNVSVSPTVQNLIVSVGEPKFDGSRWSMPTADTEELVRTVAGGMPVWVNDPEVPLEIELEEAACIQVFEDSKGPAPNTLSCRPATSADLDLQLGGVLVRKATIDLVQDALGGTFPLDGLVLGRVLDESGQPAEGITIDPSPGGPTVLYLSDDMSTVTTGAMTTSSGAFVSLDAPFDTTWGVELPNTVVEEQLGGLVTGKVTVIELQLN